MSGDGFSVSSSADTARNLPVSPHTSCSSPRGAAAGGEVYTALLGGGAAGSVPVGYHDGGGGRLGAELRKCWSVPAARNKVKKVPENYKAEMAKIT